jgi:hypothetical protein
MGRDDGKEEGGRRREEGERQQYPKVQTAPIITLRVKPGEVIDIQDGEGEEEGGGRRREEVGGGRREKDSSTRKYKLYP